jgi:hypothetical protein
MIYLKTFDQINESKDSNVLEKLLEKFSKGINNDKLLKLLSPYKDVIKKYYDKYVDKDGVIDAALISSDFKKFNFSANESLDYDDLSDRLDDKEDSIKNPILRILFKVFVKFPTKVVMGIWDIFKVIVIEAFEEGDYFIGGIGIFITILTAILVTIIGVFTYNATDWYFNGLEKGKVITEFTFTPAHDQAVVHTVSTGKSMYTYTTYHWVPDTWTTEVEGDNGRIEDWSTENSSVVDTTKIGTVVKRDGNWSWVGTEKR